MNNDEMLAIGVIIIGILCPPILVIGVIWAALQ